MSSLLCCLIGNRKNIDNNIEKDINNRNKINNISKEIDSIQTSIINKSCNISKNIPTNISHRYSKKEDTSIDINEFEKCKYWFSQIIKYSVNCYEDYGKNKKELNDNIFINVDLNKTLKYYKKYNKKYNNFNSENIKKFCQDKSNIDFIQDVKISENIYRYN